MIFHNFVLTKIINIFIILLNYYFIVNKVYKINIYSKYYLKYKVNNVFKILLNNNYNNFYMGEFSKLFVANAFGFSKPLKFFVPGIAASRVVICLQPDCFIQFYKKNILILCSKL